MADWTRDEVESIVADYFSMLDAELSGRPYSKAEHNRSMQTRIGRNKGSIEFKHQNISAVLVNFRQPFIAGYLPRQNYQKLLEQAVLEWLSVHPRFFQQLANGPVLTPRRKPDISDEVPITALIEPPPKRRVDVTRAETADRKPRFYQTDFVRRDAENRKLGRLGEQWTIEFEKKRLTDAERRPDLAQRIEWISDERGDGAGYDILSFNRDESVRLIEVKTTGLGKEFPFMVTANEVRTSDREHERYHLYRLFDFAKSPRVYVLEGSLRARCRLEPTQYRAST
jgi:hypothetical protein